MWMPEPMTVFYVCRRCRPIVPFHAYDELRAHLRVHHQMRDLPNSDICLYEAFQDARFRAPRSVRPKRNNTPSVSSTTSVQSNQSVPNVNPFRMEKERQTSAGAQRLGVNEGASSSGQQPHQSQMQQKTRSGNGNTHKEDLNINEMILSQVTTRIDAEISARMPAMTAQANRQIGQALEEQVKECVKNTLLEYAYDYHERTIDQEGTPSTRQRLREHLRRSLEDAASQLPQNQVSLIKME